MDTVEVKILQPEAIAKLAEMENDKLIELSNHKSNGTKKMPREFGSMNGLVLYIADEFDAPLDDFEEYM